MTTYPHQITAHVIELPAPVHAGTEPTAHERRGGDYFPVSLLWLPHPGDLLLLDSRINAEKGERSRRQYEVVDVLHLLKDVHEDAEDESARRGSHVVELYVVPSASPRFQNHPDDE